MAEVEREEESPVEDEYEYDLCASCGGEGCEDCDYSGEEKPRGSKYRLNKA